MKTALSCMLLIACFSMASAASEKTVAIIDTTGLSAPCLEAIRAHAQNELYVPVTARQVCLLENNNLADIGRKALTIMTSNDVCLIVLANPESDEVMHAKIMTNEQVAVINVSALKSPEELIFTRRLHRWTMRGAALLMGVGFDPDPFCVMHEYVTLQELDKMGLNFSPPWGDMFRKKAAARGLKVRPLFPVRTPMRSKAQ